MNNYIDTENIQVPPTTKNWLSYLPTILRGIGALAIIVSLYTFLARGWDASSDLFRYLIFLGHTGALAGIGLVSAKIIKEAKGARLLLILALLSIPINFAILGAFIYSSSANAIAIQYPHYMTWSMESFRSSINLTVIATIIMVPISLLGFKVLVRNMHKQSSIFFLSISGLLLIPFRQPEWVAILALVAGIAVFLFHRLQLRKVLTHKTLEGKIAFLLHFIPIAILLGRSFWLYAFDSILLSSATFIAFIAIRQITINMSEKQILRICLEIVSVGLSLMCATSLSHALFNLSLTNEITLVFTTLVMSGMIFEMSLRGKSRALNYRILATLIFTVGLIFNFLLYTNLLTAFVLLASGALLMIVSFIFQQKALFISALALITCGLWYQFSQLMMVFDFNYWIALASLGIVAIVSGSYLEANAAKIKQWFTNNKKRFGEWEY